MTGRSQPAIPRGVKRTWAMPDIASPPPLPPLPQSFDDPLGRKIIELHVWSVVEGLRGREAALLFDGLCQRLVIAGVPLWRLRGNAHIASAMGRLCLHMVARPWDRAADAICARQPVRAGVGGEPVRPPSAPGERAGRRARSLAAFAPDHQLEVFADRGAVNQPPRLDRAFLWIAFAAHDDPVVLRKLGRVALRIGPQNVGKQ